MKVAPYTDCARACKSPSLQLGPSEQMVCEQTCPDTLRSRNAQIPFAAGLSCIVRHRPPRQRSGCGCLPFSTSLHRQHTSHSARLHASQSLPVEISPISSMQSRSLPSFALFNQPGLSALARAMQPSWLTVPVPPSGPWCGSTRDWPCWLAACPSVLPSERCSPPLTLCMWKFVDFPACNH